MLSALSSLNPPLGGAPTLRGSNPLLESRYAARRHGVATSLMRTPPSLIRHPGEDVALSGESEVVIRSYFFDR